MKVAIDSGPLRSGHSVRGIGAHTKELIEGLKKLTSKDFVVEDFDGFPKEGYDVVHLTSFNPFFISLPFIKPKAKVVLTIHDLIPLIYPKNYPGGIRGKLRFMVNKFLVKKNVDAIITISETSKKDICRFLGVNPKMVYVIHLAPRGVFKKLNKGSWEKEVREKYNLPPKFLLYVGDINYNKNISSLIKASKLSDIPLVVSGKQALEIESKGMIDLNTLQGPKDYIRFLFGKPHPELAHFEKLLKEFKDAHVLRLGYVSDNDLVKIYNLAYAYVQPSFYEGFGLPVLEALACGCPVVASKTQVLVEIAEGACKFFDPNKPEEIAKSLKNLIKSPKLPRDYSWEKVAKETKRVYEEI